jgi:hypothetical protein
VEPARDCTPLPLHCVDQSQGRYELIRPLVRLAEGTASQRAQATPTHPDTVRPCVRRCRQQGMLGLLPGSIEVVPHGQAPHVPEAVREEIARLKGLYAGLHDRALARLLCATLGYRIDHQMVKQLWHHSPVTTSSPLELWASPTPPDRPQARWQAIQLYDQGWHNVRLSRFLHVSRSTVELWMARVAEAHRAGLVDHQPRPKSPRKVWFSTMVEVYHGHKRHPDAGAFRLWSLLARSALAVRTIGRMMALNRRVYDDLPQGHKPAPPKAPQPHPCKAQRPHPSWFIDGRIMECAFDGVKWWSRSSLDGSARTRRAGAVAPPEASWGALPVR